MGDYPQVTFKGREESCNYKLNTESQLRVRPC